MSANRKSLGKVIVDFDPGIDDAYALGLLVAASKEVEIELLGLTTIFGNNQDVGVCARNASYWIQSLHTEEPSVSGSWAAVPVLRGCHTPLNKNRRPDPSGEDWHGKDGLGNLGSEALFGPAVQDHSLSEWKITAPTPASEATTTTTTESSSSSSEWTPTGVAAVDFIIEASHRWPGEVTVITLGPLTNLATALVHDAGLALRLRRVAVMGGNYYAPGNVSPVAEANVGNDAEAADVVFGASYRLPLLLVPLDVTKKVHMTRPYLESLDSSAGRLLFKVVQHYLQQHHDAAGQDYIDTHDSTAIMALLHEDLFEYLSIPITVNTEDGPLRGQLTQPVSSPDSPPRPNLQIAQNVDLPKYLQLYHDYYSHLLIRSPASS